MKQKTKTILGLLICITGLISLWIALSFLESSYEIKSNQFTITKEVCHNETTQTREIYLSTLSVGEIFDNEEIISITTVKDVFYGRKLLEDICLKILKEKGTHPDKVEIFHKGGSIYDNQEITYIDSLEDEWGFPYEIKLKNVWCKYTKNNPVNCEEYCFKNESSGEISLNNLIVKIPKSNISKVTIRDKDILWNTDPYWAYRIEIKSNTQKKVCEPVVVDEIESQLKMGNCIFYYNLSKKDLNIEWLNENCEECLVDEKYWVSTREFGIISDDDCSKYKCFNGYIVEVER